MFRGAADDDRLPGRPHHGDRQGRQRCRPRRLPDRRRPGQLGGSCCPTGTAGPLPGDAGWNRARRRGPRSLRHLEHWHLDWLDAADLVAPHRARCWNTRWSTVTRCPWWGRGRVTLLGDAAHPMYPVGANGGSQAIVDAPVLADELARDPATTACVATRTSAGPRPPTSSPPTARCTAPGQLGDPARPGPCHHQVPQRHRHRQESTHDHLRPDPRGLPRRMVLRRSRRRTARRGHRV